MGTDRARGHCCAVTGWARAFAVVAAAGASVVVVRAGNAMTLGPATNQYWQAPVFAPAAI